MKKHVIIVGGGITGLSTAYHLQEEARNAGLPLTFTLLESDNRVGGKIKTEYIDDFVIDGGPDCFLGRKPWALQLSRKLGLGDELRGTNDDHRKTFVLDKGKLKPLPDGVLLIIPTRFAPFAASTLISIPGKMRMGMDLFIPPRMEKTDETVAEFVLRRLGKEALEKIAEPLMSGIHISDPETQSLLGSFPRFRDIEQKHGSLIKGMISERNAAIKKKKEQAKQNGTSNGVTSLPPDQMLYAGVRQFNNLMGLPTPDKYNTSTSCARGLDPAKPLPMFITLRRGLGQFVDAIHKELTEGQIVTGKSAVKIEEIEGGEQPRYRVYTEDGESFEGDSVIMATPAYAAAKMLDEVHPSLAQDLRKIRYVSTATVSMGFRFEDIGKPFGGFGFVIPRKENRSMMGCTWTSTKFLDRVSPNNLLLRCFVGGPGREHLAEQNDEDLVNMLLDELRSITGLEATPHLVRIYRWTKANPQYDVGHLDRVKEMFATCESKPGLFLTGSAYEGVGVPDCVNHGHKAAKKAVELLSKAGIAESVGA